MQRHLLLLCFLICCATANAEKTDSISFLCKVADAFTGDYIKDGEVDILSTLHFYARGDGPIAILMAK